MKVSDSLRATGTLLCTLLTILINSAGHSQSPQKPNVILIMTDDQGYGDLGFHGNEIIQTPHLDNLFEESVRVTNFHVSPTCTPTRGALMTGRYSNRVGTWHTIAGRSLLYEDEKTLAQIFAQNGYATGMFGKWHLGDNYPFRPLDRGFQQAVRHGGGGVTQGPDYWGNNYFDDTYWKNGEPRTYDGYVTDIFFDESMAFIEEHQERPFFAYIATNAPHSPFHVPEEYYNLYKGEDRLLEDQKRFYGMITNIDDNIGRLEDHIRKLGLRENTILIFLGDNGTAAGYRVRNGTEYGFNAGLRGTKNSEYDGGHRVPFALRWPAGNIGEDKDLDQLLAHIDLLPTLAELADLRFVETNPLDGKSFAPLLLEENPEWENRTLIVDSQRILNLVKWRKSAVMDETWRLVNGRELYNIKEDRSQENDLASKYPEVVDRLRESYEQWWTSLMEQNVNERYAYIKAGTRYENPVRISSHDMHIYPYKNAWHQHGALDATTGQGILKVELGEPGRYRISLRRYPRESGLAINEKVEAKKETLEISSPMPGSNNVKMTQATLYLGDIGETKSIQPGAEAVHFEGTLSAGKYDMTAILQDNEGRVYPSYYTYIEKIEE
ncbi:arylsulfatase [Halalkalibaculum sp. DA384]|uniref:arylsulfatase n=1 Tax=Halalkalibaculum sp. DA384 TaxID=3373606 RepID=UPI0037548417